MTSAQLVYNETTGTFICPASAPNGSFCAGTPFVTNIIIRCKNGVGQPGNCNDNLAGQPPLGVKYSPCVDSEPSQGNAACSKNCVIYPENGSSPYLIPRCAPIYSTTTSTPIGTLPPVTSTTIVDPSQTTNATSTVILTTTTTILDPSQTSHSTPPIITSYPNTTITDIFPPYPPTTLVPSGTGIPHPPSNGTTTTQPTRTPVGPTTTSTQPPQFTGAADKNSVSALAGVLAVGVLLMM